MSNKTKHLSLAATKAMLQPTRRDVKFGLNPDIISEWHHEGGPVFTAFLNTFSSILPVGERFFITSVRAFRDQVTDPELKKAVTAFIGQEAMHGREHEEYNDALFAKVPAAARFERRVKRLLDWFVAKTPANVCLSGTIALEHFTALLGDAVLKDPRVTEGADPNYAALWRWHALEETEHKAVAFDVWKVVMGTNIKEYGLRSFGQVLATVFFWSLTIPVMIQVLRSEGELTNGKAWRQFFRYTFGDIGMLRRQLGSYFDYFRPSFHPWDHDNRHFLTQIDDFLAEQEKLVA